MREARAFSVPIESERGSISCFDAFSSREPVSTSLENALAAAADALDLAVQRRSLAVDRIVRITQVFL